MTETGVAERSDAGDSDVVVVGGGPAGCAAGVFLARYGLDVAVFDRGNSSLRRCAYLENYLGFPAGIDVETFYALLHDHAAEAGCDVVDDLVESVTTAGTVGSDPERGVSDAGDGSDGEYGSEGRFVVETQDGRVRRTARVVAAARYDAAYLRPLGDDAMFETREYEGETTEHFDRDYPNPDGSTPIDGLYVASPSTHADTQALVAAGHGARVARTVIADVRRERGYPEDLAEHWDWLRREASRPDEWADRDRLREWFDERAGDAADGDSERYATLRERDIDRRLDAYVAEAEVARRTQRGHDRLLAHLDDERVMAHLDDDRLLDHVDDERILAAAREIDAEPESTVEAGDR
ncbi:FAD-dependent oxidoreductase [Halobellus rufus]|uniref:FAD-dependent oxidoreductase n=1 Tax=Halobellus rufus TaxID=1448860 RepID=UPI000678DCB9|nr:FAD-dependent oxidoreductase [Halobellus rufus]